MATLFWSRSQLFCNGIHHGILAFDHVHNCFVIAFIMALVLITFTTVVIAFVVAPSFWSRCRGFYRGTLVLITLTAAFVIASSVMSLLLSWPSFWWRSQLLRRSFYHGSLVLIMYKFVVLTFITALASRSHSQVCCCTFHAVPFVVSGTALWTLVPPCRV